MGWVRLQAFLADSITNNSLGPQASKVLGDQVIAAREHISENLEKKYNAVGLLLLSVGRKLTRGFTFGAQD